ncbi:lymphotoxin-alpha [Peromyscus maniculatus bairdii]|uniref:Lymphotoxin-alpha n=1 Tax=Peromyscus maniculatus bairdii TaxID=230844 RepID=A0A6I9MED9_PERMB|nr:lymphotoxin-alpha [Peromyscus maniculatus bairdii]XP_028743730.1 lymphotoxin-alpha [Peromyscus leucopus]
MTPLGRLYLLRVLGAPPVFLLGLLLALPLGPQGLSGVRSSAARIAHQPPQKHSTRGFLKPAAHLVGHPSKQNSLLWRANTDRAFLRHGFSLNNNSLLVPASGLYFVYSQVVFSGESCSPKATPAPIYLAHEVQLLSSQYPFHVPLLSAQKSVYPGLQGPWVRSMYQGAVFLLSKGDQLSTHTDGVSHLHFSPSSVFFGAFAL